MSSSGGPANTTVSRIASTPNASICSPRSTPLPSDLLIDLALVDHLALVQQPLHRLGEVDHADVVQHLGEEPHVQQVQDGVLDAADVLVTPASSAERPLGRTGRPRTGRAVAEEVPGRVDEGIHRVGVPAGRAAALGAGDVHPVGCGGQRRGSLRGQIRAASGTAARPAAGRPAPAPRRSASQWMIGIGQPQ